MLGADDPLDHRPQRIAVAGVTGVGKTNLARRIAVTLGVPHIELDALFHGPGWQPRPTFVDEVDEFTSRATWVTEWQYASARPLIAARADTMVWLDLPTRIALTRVVRRTVRRSIRHDELWNGNTEPPLRTIFTDPDHIIRWAVRTRRKLKTLAPAAESEFPQLQLIRLRSQREADDWVTTLGA